MKKQPNKRIVRLGRVSTATRAVWMLGRPELASETLHYPM